MGVTIESKNHSIDLGYNGFNRLRAKVAELSDNDLGLHYKDLNQAPFIDGDGKKEFFKEYNEKIVKIVDKNKIPHAVPDFIYQSDCDGSLSPEQCLVIYEVIKDYDDDILYGYSGKKDCAKFNDFKTLLKDCIDNNTKLEWF